MTKPRTLEVLNYHCPQLSLDRIKELAVEEYHRQIDTKARSILKDKTLDDLTELINYAGVSTSGKSADFDSSILGSNPSTPTIEELQEQKIINQFKTINQKMESTPERNNNSKTGQKAKGKS